MDVSKIHAFIEGHAQTQPKNIAVTCCHRTITYSELNKKANQLACYLIQAGAKPNDFIPVYLEKSIDMIVSILAILKIGAAYVPISLDSPLEVTRSIITDTYATLLISQEILSCKLDQFPINSVILDSKKLVLSKFSDKNIEILPNNSDYAYAIYTSGTTGKPKGIAITHQNLIHTYLSWKKIYQLDRIRKNYLQMANFSFDVFSGDWVRALCSGGKLVLCQKELLLNPEELYKTIVTEKIHCAEFVPAILRKLMDYLEKENLTLDAIDLLICGSDQWTVSEFRRVKRFCRSDARVINSYGLTEATIDSTYWTESDSSQSTLSGSEMVPIGKPFPHVTLYLLNTHLERVGKDEMGEICIGGKGTAKGYLNNSELTKKKFVPDPHSEEPDAILYRTGDLGYYLPDGNVGFLGRNENQVKINGQRVELPAVEAILARHPKIKHSVVTAETQKNHSIVLKAFLVLEDSNVSYEELMIYLKNFLPIYSIPSEFFEIEELSLNQNSKVNHSSESQKIIRQILPEIIPPQNELEAELLKIWKDVLQRDNIGVSNNFFDLGGSSLLFFLMLEKIEKRTNCLLVNGERLDTIKDISQFIFNKQLRGDSHV